MKVFILALFSLTLSLRVYSESCPELLSKYIRLSQLSNSFQKINNQATYKNIANINTAEDKLIAVTDILINQAKNKKILDGKDLQNLTSYFSLWEKVFNSRREIFNSINLSDPKLTKTKNKLILSELILTSHDSYLKYISQFQLDKRLRRILNREDLEFFRSKSGLSSIGKWVYSLKPKKYLQELTHLEINNFSGAASSLFESIINSSLYKEVISNPNYTSVSKFSKLKTIFTQALDLSRASFEKTLFWVNKIVGDLSVRFPLRKGLLANRPEVYKNLSKTLKPMDILLDKARFKITDKIIPGYYGHAAVFFGTKDQLIELGLWDNELIKPFQKKIEEGHNLLEARTDGVQLRKLKEFLNTDSVAVVRKENMSKAEVVEKMLNGIKQMNKPFDYSFDIEQTESFICTKVIYYLFDQIPWKTKRAVGRETFPPMHIALEAQGANRRLTPVMIYDDGELIQGNLPLHMQKRLIKGTRESQ